MIRTLSAKQWAVMDVLLRGNPDGTWVDFDQLLERLAYEPSKGTMHFTLRSLVGRGLIEKKPTELRRGSHRRVLAPTAKGYAECRK